MVCAFDSPPTPFRFTIPSLSPLAQGVLNLQTDLFLNGNAQLYSFCALPPLTWKRDKMKNDTPNRTSSREIEKKKKKRFLLPFKKKRRKLPSRNGKRTPK
ncbi:hypothetical protein CDAR_463601 [Caerostris darwini]|uniref:Uncharacterized protein n=1 Tax=Caerostris darwini TaxID=1538125 RepID=A0AAV4RQK3_9ARAC|nr:hypothetical protein CDAR_463601 [Caerostris darwini]